MKEQKVKCPEDNNKKLPYKKPQLNAVKLFADQVLGGCNSLSEGCSQAPALALTNG